MPYNAGWSERQGSALGKKRVHIGRKVIERFIEQSASLGHVDVGLELVGRHLL